ncbi:MAG: tetratricopeptide repeat protein [Candidatus Thorarchaeota archaeon]
MPLFKRRNKEYDEAALLLAEGKTSEAIEKLEQFLSRNPNHTHALTSMGVGLMQLQETPDPSSALTKKALEYLDRAAESDPKDAVPPFNKGVCLRNLGMLEEALESFQSALEREERLTLALLHTAEINYELERWQDAVDYARLTLVRDPGLENSLSWVVNAMKKAGLLEDDGNQIQK